LIRHLEYVCCVALKGKEMGSNQQQLKSRHETRPGSLTTYIYTRPLLCTPLHGREGCSTNDHFSFHAAKLQRCCSYQDLKRGKMCCSAAEGLWSIAEMARADLQIVIGGVLADRDGAAVDPIHKIGRSYREALQKHIRGYIQYCSSWLTYSRG
jgi:hypothetical protein